MGGGGRNKGGGSKKRKRAKLWDDYDPKQAKKDNASDADAKSRSSMFSQWKQTKQSQRAKQKQLVSRLETTKASQYEQLQQQLQKKKMWASSRALAAANASARDHNVSSSCSSSDEEDDLETSQWSGSDDELALELKRSKKKKATSVFDAFVRTFGQNSYEEEKADDEEDETEEMVVVEEEDMEESLEEDEEEGSSGVFTNKQNEEEDAEDEEQDGGEDEETEEEVGGVTHNEADETDPYRQRFLLTPFSKRQADQVDSLPRRLTSVRNAVPKDTPMPLEIHFRVNSLSTDGQIVAESQPPTWKASEGFHFIRSRLQQTWQQQQNQLLDRLSGFEKDLLTQLSSYRDLYFAAQTEATTEMLRRVTLMHVVNHLVKSRDTVVRNNERVRKLMQKQKAKQSTADADQQATAALDDEEQEYRDQGFCRASILLLTPLRSSALEIVKLLLQLLPSTVDTFHNKDRFFEEYGSSSSSEEEDEEEARRQLQEAEGTEWRRLFAQGNNDDCFQVGISLSRKSLRFFSEYHHADIILASPLAIRQQIGDEAAELDALDRVSCDFLSSVELCVVDYASVILMQNVDHLRTVLQATNMKPKEAPNADFSRIREWNLEFFAKYFRQTIVFAHQLEPQLNNLVNKLCHNFAGLIQYSHDFDASSGGSITRVVPQVKQIFQRFDALAKWQNASREEADARFEYFQTHVFNTLLEKPRKHVLIFIPSYFDYVRVRNLFKANEKLIHFVSCCEYTTPKQIARARTEFIHGKSQVLLVTERFHFYHQYRIRGIHQLIWYGLPVFGEFYAEWLNMLLLPGVGLGSNGANGSAQQQEMNSVALFSRLDFLRLARIVGTQKAKRMTSQKNTKATYLFC